MRSIDKLAVRRSFDDAAGYYDAHASLQRAVANRLLACSEQLCSAGRVLDAGAGSGFGTVALMSAFSSSHVVGLDFSHAMLKISRAKSRDAEHVCSDIETLPFAPSTFDLVYSSSALQWSADLDAALREFNRVMTRDAALVAAVYTDGTLRELRNSWSQVDDFPHTLEFLTVSQLCRALESAGLTVVRCQTQIEVVLYANVDALMKILKQTGVSQFRRSRRAGLTTVSRLEKMKAAYRTRYGVGGKVPASYVISLVCAHQSR